MFKFLSSINTLINTLLVFLCVLLGFNQAFALADNDQFTINNHFDKSLTFTIGINPTTLPDLPQTFNLDTQGSIHSKVLNQKEAYIRVEDDAKHSAFFGVNIENEKVRVHGYLSKGIAYSWVGGEVTFCTPEEYKKKRSCT